jgi:drug/metabolite transporter (DMT)-like permease
LGFLGIGLVFLGGYLSHLNKKNIKDSKPFKDLMKNRGVQLVFIATITAAIGNPMVKAAILASTVWTQIIVFTIIHSTLTGSLILIFKRKKINDAVKQVNVKWKNALMGNFHRTLTLVLGQIAFSLMYTAYATAIFRLSIFFQIYFGGKFFNEQNIKQRMIGAILIFAGVILILIS